jgi:hypothetical protein
MVVLGHDDCRLMVLNCDFSVKDELQNNVDRLEVRLRFYAMHGKRTLFQPTDAAAMLFCLMMNLPDSIFLLLTS